jgi:hypothetical protein
MVFVDSAKAGGVPPDGGHLGALGVAAGDPKGKR